jgi:hypothetical protein
MIANYIMRKVVDVMDSCIVPNVAGYDQAVCNAGRKPQVVMLKYDIPCSAYPHKAKEL